MKPRQHVIPDRYGWAVKSESGQFPAEEFPTKEAAMRHALAIAQRERSNIIEHNIDGSYAEHIVRAHPFETALYTKTADAIV